MLRQIFVLSILCVCTFTVVTAGRERVPVKTDLQHQFDRNRDGFIDLDEQAILRKYSEARERIESLLAEAREAEQSARRMRAEAKEIEQSLQRRFRGLQQSDAPERMQKKLPKIREAAGRAEQDGRVNEAKKQRQQVRKITGQVDGQKQRGQEEHSESRRDIHSKQAERREGRIAKRPRTDAERIKNERQQQSRRKEPVNSDEQRDRNLRNTGRQRLDNTRQNRLDQQIEQLRNQVNSLRKEIEELKEVVNSKL